MTGSALDHNYVNGYCSDCGTKDPNYVAPITAPTLTPTGFTLSFEDEILVNFYYTVSNVTDVTEQGMLVFYTDPGKADFNKADDVYTDSRYVESSGSYIVTTHGIAAKEIDQPIYVCGVYEVDGVMYSTGVIPYSVATYCVNKASGESAIKYFAEAMVVYGYHAKTYFGL